MSKKEQKKTLEELLEEALVPEDEQPYQIPKNWVWVKLKDISHFIDYRGKTPLKTSSGIRLITAKNVRMGFIKDDPLEFIDESDYYSWMNRGIPDKGDILFTTEAPLGNVAQLDTSNKVALAQRIITISPFVSLDQVFLKYCLMSPQIQQLILNNATGSTVSGIKSSRLKLISIPLATLKEQRRIGKKIDRLFEKIERAERLIKEVKESFEPRWESLIARAFSGDLTQNWRTTNKTVLPAGELIQTIKNKYKKNKIKDNDAITATLELPSTWEWVRLGDVIDINPPKKKLTDVEDEEICSFIPMQAVSDKNGEITNPETKVFKKVKRGYTFFIEGDIIFAKITPCMENGKTAIAKNLHNGFAFGSTEFHVLRANPLVNTKFVYYLLRAKQFRLQAKAEMTGAVGQQRVPKAYLENYAFPLPPKEEQDRIVEILEELNIRELKLKEISGLENQLFILKQSILNKAFRGELGTNDPAEESALTLLKEVLQEKIT